MGTVELQLLDRVQVGIMKGLSVFILIISVVSAKKMVVTYLGTDFILPGGCPPPPTCNSELRDCRKSHLDMVKLFDECMKDLSAKQGCVTDRLPGGKDFTIPTLANFCSKHCVSDNSLDIVHPCPYEGFIHTDIDPELLRRISE